MLLLEHMGVAQKTDLERSCLTRDLTAMAAWRDLRKLDAEEAWNRAIARPSAQ